MGILDQIVGNAGNTGQPRRGLLGAVGGAQGLLQNPATMDLGLALLANSGYSSRRRGFGEILGTSMLQSRQMAAEAAQQKLREQYMQAQIQAMQQKPEAAARSPFAAIDPSKYSPESIVKFQQSGNYGDLVPTSVPTADSGTKIGAYNPGDYTPASFSKFLQSQNPADLKRQYAPQSVPGAWIGQIGGGLGVIPRTAGGGVMPPNMLTTPGQESDAAAERAASQRRSTELAAEQAKREATFETDMSAIEDEIIRTQRLKTEFEEGKYQTGPLAGRLPAMRTNAQNLRREAGKDVIRNISSATFGALSEGEREFLKNIGISENVTEESNVAYLDERLATLKRARDRLRARPPLVQSPGAGAQQGAGAPQEPFTVPPGVTIRMLPPLGK
jgi:hypothetical protein